MGLEIGQLFVNLGIKGSEKTVGAITSVHKGLGQTASMGLEAKAAIIGAVYAMERLFAASNQRGTDLTNFNAQLGVGAKVLQQYEWAAQQVGVSNQEVEGSFKSLQSAMTKVLKGEAPPSGLERVSQLTGGLEPEDIDRFAKQPQLLIDRLQEYAQKETNVGLKNDVLSSFGMGDGMNAALSRGAFQPSVMAKAPTYSDGELKSLDRAHALWSNLGTKIEMAFGHFNASHGGKLVGDLSLVTDKVVKLAEAFIKLSDKAHLFDWLGKVFEGWALIFDGLTKAIEYLQDITSDDPKKGMASKGGIEGVLDDTSTTGAGFMAALVATAGEAVEAVVGKSKSELTPDQIKRFNNASSHLGQPLKGDNGIPVHAVAPPLPPGVPQAQTGTQVNVNQTMHFNDDGKDPQKVSDAHRKGVLNAYNAFPKAGT